MTTLTFRKQVVDDQVLTTNRAVQLTLTPDADAPVFAVPAGAGSVRVPVIDDDVGVVWVEPKAHTVEEDEQACFLFKSTARLGDTAAARATVTVSVSQEGSYLDNPAPATRSVPVESASHEWCLDLDDDTAGDEDDGSVTVTMTDLDRDDLSIRSDRAAATVTVRDDEPKRTPVVYIENAVAPGSDDVHKVDEGESVELVLKRDGYTTKPLTAPLEWRVTTAGAAWESRVSSAAPTSVTWPAGKDEVTVSLPTRDDVTRTRELAFTVRFPAPAANAGYVIRGRDAASRFTIVDDDAPTEVSVAASNASIDEGEDAVFTFTRGAGRTDLDHSDPLRAGYTIVKRRAGARQYSTSGNLVFDSNRNTAVITVETEDNDRQDPDLTIEVTLVPGGADALHVPAEGSAQATVTVRENDLPIVIIRAGTARAENLPAIFLLYRFGVLDGELEVLVKVEETGDGDYLTGSVTPSARFQSGEKVIALEVPVDDDATAEPVGELTASVQEQASRYRIGLPSSAAVAVSDNEPASLFLSASQTLTEGDDAVFKVSRSGSLDDEVSVTLRIAGFTKIMTAATRGNLAGRPGVQFLHPYGNVAYKIGEQLYNARVPVTITAGAAQQTLTLTTEDDEVNEGDGELRATLLAPGLRITGSNSKRILVEDDDIPRVWLELSSPLPAGVTLTGTAYTGSILEGTPPLITFKCSPTAGHEERRFAVEYRPYLRHPIANPITLDPSYRSRYVWSCGTSNRTDGIGGDSFYTGPNGGDYKVRILTREEAAVDSLGNYAKPWYDPRYTVGSPDEIRLRVLNREPVITIRPDTAAIEEGQTARFVLTRHWAADLLDNPYGVQSYTNVALRIGQRGGYATAELRREIRFADHEREKIVAVATEDDALVGEDGEVSIEILPDDFGDRNPLGNYELYDVISGITPEGGNSRIAAVTVRNNDDFPVLSMEDAATREDQGVLVFVVELAGPATRTEDATVSWTTQAGTATADTDYTSGSGTLTFATTVSSTAIRIPLRKDADAEPNETLQVVLSDPTHASFAAGASTLTATGHILDDDSPVLARAAMEQLNPTTPEHAGPLRIRVYLDRETESDVYFSFRAKDFPDNLGGGFATARAGEDYVAVDRRLTFTAGVTEQTVEVSIIDDRWDEGSHAHVFGEGIEVFALSLAAPTDVDAPRVEPHPIDGHGPGMILDDDTPSAGIDLTVSPAALAEGDGAGSVTVTAQLDGAWRTQATEVELEVSGGTAADADFTAVDSFTITIGAGTSSQTGTFTLTPVADEVDEADETVEIRGRNSSLPVTAAAVTITDDDTRGVTVRPTELAIAEGESEEYTVVLRSAPADITQIAITPSRHDVVVDPPDLIFTEDDWDEVRTVTVWALHDADAQDAEVVIAHAASGGDYQDQEVAGVTVRVADDDPASTLVTLTLDPEGVLPEAGGGGAFVVTATLDAAARVADTAVTISAEGVTATSGKDFAALAPFDLVIPAGEQSSDLPITLTPVDDVLDEEDETLRLRGSTTVAGMTVAPADGLAVTIEDDDTRAVQVSETELTVLEGKSGTYTVALATQPTADVTVTLAAAGSGDVSVAPAALTFTPDDWQRAQEVAVSVAGDVDAEDEEAVVTHAVGGGDYDGVTAEAVTVTVTDDDTASSTVTLSLDVTSIAEHGGSRVVNLAGELDAAPRTEATAVTVTVSADTAAAADYSVSPGAFTLTIPALRASGSARFTVTPVDDAVDEEDETLIVRGSTAAAAMAVAPAAGLALTITDDDVAHVRVTPTTVDVAEGGSGEYRVVLATQPTGSVTVAVAVPDGTDVTVSPVQRTFSATDWDVAQTITVSAAEDGDAAIEAPVVLTHTATGGGYAGAAADSTTVRIAESDVATLSVADARVNESDSPALFLVRLSAASEKTITVDYASADGAGKAGATAGDDYEAQSGTLTFAPDTTTAQEIRIRIVNDDADERATETFTLSLSDPVNAVLAGGAATQRATGTIVDDDVATLSVTDVSVGEETGPLRFDVALSTPSVQTVVLDFATKDGTATAGSDYAARTGSLTFALKGPLAQAIEVAVADDLLDEPDETVLLTLQVRSNRALRYSGPVGVSWEATGTIRDDDDEPELSVSVSDSTMAESGGSVRVTVASKPDPQTMQASTFGTDQEFALSYTGTATLGGDFQGAATLLLPAGVTQVSTTLTATDDQIDDDGEYLEVTVRRSGAVVDAARRVTITDDDARGVAVDPTTLTVNEGGSKDYTVVLESEPTGDVVVTAARKSGGSSDVSVRQARLTFTASDWDDKQTVTVSAEQDDDAENDSAVIGHTVSGGDYGSESASDVAVTVDDDEVDSTEITLSVNRETVSEGAGATSVTVTAALNSGTRSSETPVTVTVGSGTATSGTDFTAVADVELTIASGAVSGTGSFTLTPAADTVDEPDETVSVGGTMTVSGLSVTGTTVKITDDDATPAVTLELSDDSIGEDGGEATVTAKLNHASSDETTVEVSAVAVSPAVAGDLTLSANKMLTIAAGATASSGDVTITGVANAVDAADKSVTVKGEGTNTQGVTDPVDVTLTLEDDDTRGVEVDPTTLTVNEAAGKSYTVVLESEPTGDVVVRAARESGSTDVSVSPTSLTFTSGTWDEKQTVTVSAGSDLDAVNDSAVIGHTVSGGDYGSETASHVAVQVDDDEVYSTAIALTVDPATVSEGAPATGVTVTAQFNAAPRLNSTPVTVTVGSGTGTAGTDFTAVADVALTIASGAVSGTGSFTLTPTADTVDEPDETVKVEGSTTVSGLSVTATVVKITDDDATPAVTLELSDASIGEAGGEATVTAKLTHASSERTVVEVSATAVTPAVAGDFTLSTNRKLTIAVGATASSGVVTITGVANAVDAANKSVTVKGDATNTQGVSDPAEVTLTLTGRRRARN